MCRLVRSILQVASAAAVVAVGPVAAAAQTSSDRESRVVGVWMGALALEPPFRVVLHVHGADAALSGAVDFPDQSAMGLPLTEVRLTGDSLHLRLAPAGVAFAGRLVAPGDSIVGTFSQGTQRFPLVLRRSTQEQIRGPDRPQQPAPPYPYRVEEVRIGDSGVVLAGTLTLPARDGPHSTVLLLPGSGPLDRDASVAGHRPFHVLADALTRRGFAVLRYAKRGIPPSTGDFASATTADLARDASAAVRFLRDRADVDGGRIALFGHSEGALVAAMVAADDPRIATSVLFGPPALTGDSLMLVRAHALLRDRNLPDRLLRRDAALRRAVLRAIVTPGDATATRARARAVVDQEFQRMTSSDLAALGYSQDDWNEGVEVYIGQLAWFRYFFALDPLPLYRRMHGPVLALLGGLDWQVPPALNGPPLRAALARRRDGSSTEVLSAVNHQMQPATTGAPGAYGTITETISPAILDRIERWLASHLTP